MVREKANMTKRWNKTGDCWFSLDFDGITVSRLNTQDFVQFYAKNEDGTWSPENRIGEYYFKSRKFFGSPNGTPEQLKLCEAFCDMISGRKKFV